MKNFSFLEPEQAEMFSQRMDHNLYVIRRENKLIGLFYQGIISNFYKATIMVNPAVLDAFVKSDLSPVGRMHSTEFVNYMNNVLDANHRSVAFTCGEQVIMAMKAAFCNDYDALDDILTSGHLHPFKIKEKGRAVKGFTPKAKAWDRFRLTVAHFIVWYRYNNHPEFTRIVSTLFEAARQDPTICDIQMYEASPSDNIWGVGMSAHDAAKRMLAAGMQSWESNHSHKVFTVAFERLIQQQYVE